MPENFTMELMNTVLQKCIDEYRAEGLSDSEIIEKLSAKKIENALIKITEAMASDSIDILESTLYERVLYERARATQFLAHNEQIWEKGFIASENMYIISLEMAKEYNDYIATLPKEKYASKQFRYLALHAIHGRACQQFLEILYLLKAGFADGAYARWRSLYELSIIAEFINKNDEVAAKAYFESAETDDDYHDWAKAVPCFANNRHVTFDNIKRQCVSEPDIWRSQYKLSNKVVHASPNGTFGRLANGPGLDNLVPVGHSDYGLATPAINSATTLALISIYFFSVFHYGDNLVYIQVIQKWAEIVKKYYAEIEATSFENCSPSQGDSNQEGQEQSTNMTDDQ